VLEGAGTKLLVMLGDGELDAAVLDTEDEPQAASSSTATTPAATVARVKRR
jgi:hypothetical protein